MNHKKLAILLGGILISGTLVLMGSLNAGRPWPEPPTKVVKGPNLLGLKRAEGVLKALKEKDPKINIDLETLSRSVVGNNLMEAIRNKDLLGGKKLDTCSEARELLPQACEGVSVEGKSLFVGSVEDIAKRASCQTVEGLLEYCTNQDDPAGDQGGGACFYIYDVESGGFIGQCGCYCECCSML